MVEQAFVARERELARLSSFLDRTLDDQGQVCFVTGNAGSGKTALVTEFARRAQEAHANLLVAVGTCNAQTGIGNPYLPFRELLGLLTGDVESKLAQGAISQENAQRLRAFFLRSVQVLVELGPDLVGALVPGSRLIALAGKVVFDKVGWMDKLDELASRKPARSHLGEALAEQSRIFEQLNDQSGVAETLDLLGMASVLGGDLNRSVAYYEQAVDLFRELDDRQGLVSSLAESMGWWDYLSDTMARGEGGRTECLANGERALEIAREINYRSGEAYALLALGFGLGPIGDYARALDYAQAGLGIAEEIEHHQWMAMAHCALGALYLDLLALSQAQEYLVRALALSKEIGSLFWTRCVTGFLASTYIQQNEWMLAKSLLDAAVEPGTPLETMGQRLMGCARGELALAAGEPVLALQVADQLIASALNLAPGQTIPRLSRLRGEALAAQHQTEEAEAELQAALETASVQGTPPLQWRIHKSLGNLYQAVSQPEEAERHFWAARKIVGELAANIPDEAVRREFLRRATYG